MSRLVNPLRQLTIGILLLLFVLYRVSVAQKIIENLSCDFNDDTLCEWSFSGGKFHFENIFNFTSLNFDNVQDRVVVLRAQKDSQEDHLTAFSFKSPTFLTGEEYRLTFDAYMNFVGNIFVIVVQDSNTESQIVKIPPKQKWETYSINLPKFINISLQIEIKFESEQLDLETDYVALNNFNIIDKRKTSYRCDYKCSASEMCVAKDNICDTVRDCPSGDDESQHCDLLPKGSYCNFDTHLCNWFNEENSQWEHIQDSSGSTSHSGYIGAVFKGEHRFGAFIHFKSTLFEPIPLYHSVLSSKYYKSCRVRFSYKFNFVSVDLSLDLEPLIENEKRGKKIEIWRLFNKKKSIREWANVSMALPTNFHYRYRLVFAAALGLKSKSTNSKNVAVAIDNFSLSKECFAIDVPESEPRTPAFIPSINQGQPFTIPRNKSLRSYTFTTCGAKGRKGPTYSQCESYYLNSSTRAAVFENENLSLNGSQMWTVPLSGYYVFFARGADGGNGLYNHSGGKGALVRAAFFLQEGDTIFISIGQRGADACSSLTTNLEHCNLTQSNLDDTIRKTSKHQVGGGGGGGTYVFQFKPHLPQKWTPLLIAGGGGGGSGQINFDRNFTENQHGRGFDLYNIGSIGSGNGSGGGWKYNARYQVPLSEQTGKPMLSGAEGGLPCKRLEQWHTEGGFGGGGGGCLTGGGGGGFHGGNTNEPSHAGDGGTSYVAYGQSYLQAFSNWNNMDTTEWFKDKTDGVLVVIGQIDSCCNGGKFACLVTGENINGSLMQECICGHNHFMWDRCIYQHPFYLTLLWITLAIIVLVFILFFVAFFIFQKKGVKKKLLQRNESNDMHLLSCSSSTDMQLSRLRGHQIITEYNPNYEFGGSNCTVQDLEPIPRDKLNLVKALGQGAFGEVYQGALKDWPSDGSETLNVAVKTLPEYSANKQAEMDFVMEALIMQKFKHRNVVRLYGVCFEKMPRFIVLELLPGGDLKTFLRENRSKIDSPSTLVMGDLLVMALDVACGCQYLESNHFIHRDIAARNCLLTAQVKKCSNTVFEPKEGVPFDLSQFKNGFNDSGIVVKIADFGMARDIYRADYYRKGGKAMLPVKWMPPEAFLDGVFTTKTDVWSFGVLLWEVMSMGFMPYPGRGNQEVMRLVTKGGRLEAPNSSTPSQVYTLMTQCWNATPEFRPNFSTIIERIGQCLNDPNVLNVNLPVFHRSASVEKDITLMRPPPDTTDYLVPNKPGSQTNSNYSMATEKELLSPDTCSTLSCIPDEKLVELDDQVQLQNRSNPNRNNLWNEEMLTSPVNQVMDNNSTMPVNLMLNSPPNYPNPQSFNSNIVLNPNHLTNYQQEQQQQPCVRYISTNPPPMNQMNEDKKKNIYWNC